MAEAPTVDAQQYRPMADEEGARAYLKNATAEVRLGFIRKVYCILTMQLFLTVLIAAPMQQMPREWFAKNQWLLLVSVGLSLATTCAFSCKPELGKNYPTNYILLFIFTIATGGLVGAVSACYTSGTVFMCAAMTVVIFFSMTLYAWTTKNDFTGYGPYLFGGLMALFVASIFMFFFGATMPMMNKLIALAFVVLFTLYIVYDTQLIIGEYKGHKNEFSIDEYVLAAITLYLDIINLFLYLLKLLGQRR